MTKVLEKTERRLGEKLFLKGDRCAGPKCAAVRRAYPPGVHGKQKRRRRDGSEFGSSMREKQKLKYLYNLDDKEMKRYHREAVKSSGIFSSVFLRLIERRLDNVIFRLGFVASRRIARQVVGHGHITVHGKTVDIPSYRVRVGDVIAVKERAFPSSVFADYEGRMKRAAIPSWLEVNKEKRAGKVLRMPEVEDTGMVFDVTKIKEFYSR